ncbi:xylose isomerase [Chryseobacterium formosense]|uniref:Xylose isomerase n=1 Tax=Chryseobacterium formosense TaxID=236814 RepID=A0A085Z8P7_9FLAO|nr:sugar phosphate isomerase/epimerase [Chryseobacterium formosense]KFF00811.1 xylose isomerase [Chryseobacterium formosense]SFT38169.1 Sugar phosphate isomerase/epimerase [Chryseobacterium formosense]
MKRKEFLSLSSLGFLGISCGASVANHPSTNLAIQLYTVRNAVSKDLEKTLERLAVLGFKNLEIYGYNGTFFGKNRTEFKSILKNTGLEIISSHHRTGITDKENGTLLQNWDKTLEDLNFIGSKYAVCSYLPEAERTIGNYQKLPEVLENAGKLSKQNGIQLAYHNHDFEFLKMDNENNFYDFILKNTSSDLVKIELDLYWISKAGLDPLDYFEKYPKRFPLWHVKDMKSDTKDFTEIGNGTIDFKRIFEAKEKAGLEHWFVEQDSSDKDIFESISMSTKYIKENRFFFYN